MRFKYEEPKAEILLFCSLSSVASDEYDPDAPSGIEEGFEKWPED